MNNFLKAFWQKYFGFDSAMARALNRELSVSSAVLVIFTFLLLLLVFSLNLL